MAAAKSDPRVTMEVDRDGVAVVTIDNPPMNALHPLVLGGLFYHLERAQSNPSIKAIILRGANGLFCAGFDVSLFRESKGGGIVSGDANAGGWVNEHFCDLLESGPKPTVAAIDGIALGGGCEASVACNARVCTPKSRIGLPELQLGIIPGFGGTQRLPRLVGLAKSLEMMLTSKPVSGSEAKKLGLVEEVVPPEKLMDAARDLALGMADGRRARVMTLYRTDRIPPLNEVQAICDIARAQSTKQAPGIQHPHLCIDAIQHGIEHGGKDGLRVERQAFDTSVSLDVHKALIHTFFAMRSTKRLKGVTDVGLRPRPMTRVGVLGGGLMGSGIATSLAMAGCQVLLKEINEKFLQDGLNRIRSNVQSQVKKSRMSQSQADAVFSRVTGVLGYDNFHSLDMVIEAVIEVIPLKQKIFADLEKACNAECILATNTSTIDINVIGEKTRAGDRIVGAHFFSPAHLMPLLEIVRSEHTSKQVVLDTLGLASQIKKTPVVVGNCTGFAVNRVFFPYTMGACLLVDIGLNPYRIDKAIHGSFGMPVGPFRLSDLVGADVGMHVGKNFVESFPERVYITQIMILMNKYKRLGEKTGKGFYKFENGRKAVPDPLLEPILEESRRAAGLSVPGQAPPKMTDQDIIEFIFFPVVNEGCRVIAEGVVDKPADLDVATILGMGFPTPRGGLIFWADLVGAEHINKKLNELADRFPSCAGYFRPCQYLAECAASGRPLESGVAPSARL
ncbi:hypothetical protein BSKO_08040 [Bryopsis sp. KO-2023]|nr:hypothetical protein BSKO_08040 [Bryopsis sp. KO-2023]